MMNATIAKARVYVKGKFKSEGSVLAETVRAQSTGFETRLEVESEEAPERVAAVIRNAERGCYVLQTLLQPVPVTREFVLNGEAFDPVSFKE
jgi:uncharacterized OsmC-like protein